jgi:hypothetical protein
MVSALRAVGWPGLLGALKPASPGRARDVAPQSITPAPAEGRRGYKDDPDDSDEGNGAVTSDMTGTEFLEMKRPLGVYPAARWAQNSALASEGGKSKLVW